VSKGVFGRVRRFVGPATLVMALAAASPVMASSPKTRGHATGGSGFVSGGADFGVGAPLGSVTTHGDSKHLGDRILRQGMHGHDVRVLQAYLTFAGYGTVVDGSFGAVTKQSVSQFEQTHSLSPDGIVSIALAQKLRVVVAAVQANPPTGKTRINPDGTATAPAGAPAPVVQAIAAANQIIGTSYRLGGGHAHFVDTAYDCSGAVSYALHGAGLLASPEDSVQLETYGSPGPGRYITIYADSSHAFIVIAGRAFNTASFGGPNIPAGDGPRWRSDPLGNLADGGNYSVTHPPGL
jgi:peptidoglycan hydrolase-like protein with peptidoglycan-binding domain